MLGGEERGGERRGWGGGKRRGGATVTLQLTHSVTDNVQQLFQQHSHSLIAQKRTERLEVDGAHKLLVEHDDAGVGLLELLCAIQQVSDVLPLGGGLPLRLFLR